MYLCLHYITVYSYNSITWYTACPFWNPFGSTHRKYPGHKGTRTKSPPRPAQLLRSRDIDCKKYKQTDNLTVCTQRILFHVIFASDFLRLSQFGIVSWWPISWDSTRVVFCNCIVSKKNYSLFYILYEFPGRYNEMCHYQEV